MKVRTGSSWSIFFQQGKRLSVLVAHRFKICTAKPVKDINRAGSRTFLEKAAVFSKKSSKILSIFF